MTHPEHSLMEAEADLYATLSSSRYPFFNDYVTDLSFADTPFNHEYRVALHRALMANAKFLESTANLLASLTQAHGLPPIC